MHPEGRSMEAIRVPLLVSFHSNRLLLLLMVVALQTYWRECFLNKSHNFLLVRMLVTDTHS
jgi:hypothetical protein